MRNLSKELYEQLLLNLVVNKPSSRDLGVLI